MDEFIQVMTRVEAHAQKVTKYRVEKPCKHNHAPIRYTVSGQCVECMKQRATVNSKRFTMDSELARIDDMGKDGGQYQSGGAIEAGMKCKEKMAQIMEQWRPFETEYNKYAAKLVEVETFLKQSIDSIVEARKTKTAPVVEMPIERSQVVDANVLDSEAASTVALHKAIFGETK